LNSGDQMTRIRQLSQQIVQQLEINNRIEGELLSVQNEINDALRGGR